MTRPSSLRLLAAIVALNLLPAPALAQEPAGAGSGPTLLCLAPAVVEAAPAGADPLSAVRETFTAFLTGPSLTVTPVSARLGSHAREEARLAGCDVLLLPTVKHERRTGGGGVLGKVASGAVQQGAWSVSGAAGSTLGRAVTGAAAGAASGAAADYAASGRTRDELSLGIRLESSAGAVILERSGKRKAKSDGEDLLTPLVQGVAEDIASAVRKPGRTAR